MEPQKAVKTDNTQSSVCHGDILRLRSSIVEIIEDIKLKQTAEKDNEDRINRLLAEKYELERKLECDKWSRQTVAEKHQQESIHVKQQCEDKLRTLEEEQKQFQIMKSCAEKEMKAMKEEARTLQLTKYKLEKRVKELEARLGSQERSSESQLRQLSGVEKKMAAIKVHTHRLEGSQSRLDRNVEEAVKLNRSLVSINKHQQCVINQLRHETSSLRSQVVEARAACRHGNGDVAEVQRLKDEVSSLAVKISMLEMEKSSAQRELDACQENLQATVENLKTAQTVIQQLQNDSARQEEQLHGVEDHVDQLKQQCEDLAARHREAAQDAEQLRETSKETELEWAEKVRTWEIESAAMKDDVRKTEERLHRAQDEAQHLNTRLKDTTQRLAHAQAVLNVERSSKELQTDVSFFLTSSASAQTDSRDVISVGTQISVETSQAAAQTVTEVTHSGCQTQRVMTSSSLTQTFVASVLSQWAQTAQVQTVNGCAQTDPAQTGQPNGCAQTDPAQTGQPLVVARSKQDTQVMTPSSGSKQTTQERGSANGASTVKKTSSEVTSNDPSRQKSSPMECTSDFTTPVSRQATKSFHHNIQNHDSLLNSNHDSENWKASAIPLFESEDEAGKEFSETSSRHDKPCEADTPTVGGVPGPFLSVAVQTSRPDAEENPNGPRDLKNTCGIACSLSTSKTADEKKKEEREAFSQVSENSDKFGASPLQCTGDIIFSPTDTPCQQQQQHSSKDLLLDSDEDVRLTSDPLTSLPSSIRHGQTVTSEERPCSAVKRQTSRPTKTASMKAGASGEEVTRNPPIGKSSTFSALSRLCSSKWLQPTVCISPLAQSTLRPGVSSPSLHKKPDPSGQQTPQRVIHSPANVENSDNTKRTSGTSKDGENSDNTKRTSGTSKDRENSGPKKEAAESCGTERNRPAQPPTSSSPSLFSVSFFSSSPAPPQPETASAGRSTGGLSLSRKIASVRPTSGFSIASSFGASDVTSPSGRKGVMKTAASAVYPPSILRRVRSLDAERERAKPSVAPAKISPRRTALPFTTYGNPTAALTSPSPVPGIKSMRVQSKCSALQLTALTDQVTVETKTTTTKKGILKGPENVSYVNDKTVRFSLLQTQTNTMVDSRTTSSPAETTTTNYSSDEQPLFSDAENDDVNDDVTTEIGRQCTQIVGLLEESRDVTETVPLSRKRKLQD
ncbi:uncharacterized protein [Littorina saxatilis]|uniref:uncharacterized protein n=1 Tax=Littorina saxatilis TaxID=31220 RepID=UPI0038B6A1C6